MAHFSQLSGHIMRSGKGVALLSLPPLRTVRATFIAYRSSISKALLDGETRQLVADFTIPTEGQRNVSVSGRTSKVKPAILCFPRSSCFIDLLVTRHQLEVSSFSRRVLPQPVSIPLQHRLRFLQPPVPAASSVGLATTLPRGKTTGLPCSACLPEWGRCQLYADGATSAGGEA